MLAANAPDIDILSYVRGEYFALSFRRGITHGWPALLVLPFVVAGIILAWDRWVRRRIEPRENPVRAVPILGLSAVGLLTHPALDWMNTYGMRWSLPFDGTWTYGDALFIIDPWIWLALGGAIFLASNPSRRGLLGWAVIGTLASLLVLAAFGPVARILWALGVVTIVSLRFLEGPRAMGERGTLVRVAGVGVVLYIGVLVAANGVARKQVLRAARADGLTTRDVMVAPVRGNPFVSEVEVLTDDAYVPGVHSWVGTPRVELFPGDAVPLVSGPAALTREKLEDVAATAREQSVVSDYLVWSRYPYMRVEPDGNGWDVLVSDARYDGVPGAGGLSGLRVHVPGTEDP